MTYNVWKVSRTCWRWQVLDGDDTIVADGSARNGKEARAAAVAVAATLVTA